MVNWHTTQNRFLKIAHLRLSIIHKRQAPCFPLSHTVPPPPLPPRPHLLITSQAKSKRSTLQEPLDCVCNYNKSNVRMRAVQHHRLHAALARVHSLKHHNRLICVQLHQPFLSSVSAAAPNPQPPQSAPAAASITRARFTRLRLQLRHTCEKPAAENRRCTCGRCRCVLFYLRYTCGRCTPAVTLAVAAQQRLLLQPTRPNHPPTA